VETVVANSYACCWYQVRNRTLRDPKPKYFDVSYHIPAFKMMIAHCLRYSHCAGFCLQMSHYCTKVLFNFAYLGS